MKKVYDLSRCENMISHQDSNELLYSGNDQIIGNPLRRESFVFFIAFLLLTSFIYCATFLLLWNFSSLPLRLSVFLVPIILFACLLMFICLLDSWRKLMRPSLKLFSDGIVKYRQPHGSFFTANFYEFNDIKKILFVTDSETRYQETLLNRILTHIFRKDTIAYFVILKNDFNYRIPIRISDDLIDNVAVFKQILFDKAKGYSIQIESENNNWKEQRF